MAQKQLLFLCFQQGVKIEVYSIRYLHPTSATWSPGFIFFLKKATVSDSGVCPLNRRHNSCRKHYRHHRKQPDIHPRRPVAWHTTGHHLQHFRYGTNLRCERAESWHEFYHQIKQCPDSQQSVLELLGGELGWKDSLQ